MATASSMKRGGRSLPNAPPSRARNARPPSVPITAPSDARDEPRREGAAGRADRRAAERADHDPRAELDGHRAARRRRQLVGDELDRARAP